MSEGELLTMLGSAAAVAALVAIAWLLGFRTRARLASEEDARAAIQSYERGAAVAGVVLDTKGLAALARLADGRLALARSMGDRIAVRTAPARDVRVRMMKAGLIATLPDIGYPPLRVRFDGAPPDWLKTLMETGS